MGGKRQCAPPFRIGGLAFVPGHVAPAHGEHGEEVLREAGLPADAVAGLVARGVVRGPSG